MPKVLMVGGYRTGKSTILGSIVDQMTTNGDLIANYIVLKQFKEKGYAYSDNLYQKMTALKSFCFDKIPGRLYMIDFFPDDSYNIYHFTAQIPDGNGRLHHGNIKIEFVDCPGNIYSEDHPFQEILESHFNTSDIFIIAVDTPYLMDDDSNAGFFSKVNQVNQILRLFQQNIIFKDDDDYKKVIFVPVKCEKWANKINEVTKKLQLDYYYGPLFDYLSTNPRFSVSIIPAFTTGNIEFAEFGEAFITVNTKEKCSPAFPAYRFWDGTIHNIDPEDSAIKNPYFTYTSHTPFYSWFKNKRCGYAPQNCDQLALHIWRFILYKTKVEQDRGSILSRLRGYPNKKNLIKTIRKMQTGGLLKDSGDGILNISLVEKV